MDTGCSNHMTCAKEIFIYLDETQNVHALLGNGKEIHVKVKGIMKIESGEGKRSLYNTRYIPDLGYNLLSI